MNIEVYSIKSFTGSALKRKLESALAEKNLPYTVKEINDVDDFIKAGLTSVPAVKVGSKVIEHHDEFPVDTTVQMALEVIMEVREKFILVPVDFSPESIHALRYARMMASHLDMGITAVHIHQPLFDPITGSAFDVEMMQKNRERLDEMVIGIGWDQYRVHDHVPVQTHFETGDVSSSLLHLAQDDKYGMIIMSTKSEDSFAKRMIGSVSTNVSRMGSKPVIVVPPGAPIKFPGKIAVGMTEDLLKGKALEEILTFASEHQVFVDFVFATNDQEQFTHLKNSLYERLVLHKDQLCGFNIRYVSFVKDEVHKALNDYAVRARSEMLVLVTLHRNFLDRLMHASVSKKVLYHPSIPVMITHAAKS